MKRLWYRIELRWTLWRSGWPLSQTINKWKLQFRAWRDRRTHPPGFMR